MKYYVDIDETICRYSGRRHYPDAEPIRENIEAVNALYDDGHHITYWTARGTVTGINWLLLTKSQLISWGAKHHELLMGKPAYDRIICDKSMRIEEITMKQVKRDRYLIAAWASWAVAMYFVIAMAFIQ